MRETKLTAKEREFVCCVLAEWVNEGFTTPPYPSEFYSIADKVGLTQSDAWVYDISRPDA